MLIGSFRFLENLHYLEGTYNFYICSVFYIASHGFLCINVVFSYVVNL